MGGHHVPSSAQTAELQGIQAEAAPGAEQGLKFGAASAVPTDCSHGQALARMSPAHCTSCHPNTGHPWLAPAPRQLSTGPAPWGEQDASLGSGAGKEAKPPQTNQPGQ